MKQFLGYIFGIVLLLFYLGFLSGISTGGAAPAGDPDDPCLEEIEIWADENNVSVIDIERDPAGYVVDTEKDLLFFGEDCEPEPAD